MLGSASAVDEEYTVVLGSACEAGPVVEVCSSTAAVLGSISAVGEVKTRSVVEPVSAKAVVLGLVSAVVKVKTRSVVEVSSSTTGVVASVSAVGQVKIWS